MANLSNINNILRISSSGVGLNKDNIGPSELDIESAGADMIDMTRTGQKTYRFAISGASAFSLFDVAANEDRLIINSAGNATFAGNVSVIGSSKFIEVGSANTGTNFGFIGWNTASKYLFLGNSYNSAYNEDLVIDSSGNVGIGTSLPGRGLTIDKSNANAALEIIKNNTTNQIVYLGTGSSGGTDDPLLRMFHNGTENIRLYTTGDSWINGGNVGIGTNSPDAKLDISNVAGATYALEISTPERNRALFYYNSASTSDAGYLGIKRGSVDALNHRFATTGNSAVCIGEGNFGIGTDSPGAQLHNYSTATSNVFISGYGTSAQNNWMGEHAFFVHAGNGIIVGKANASNDTNRLYTFYNDNQGNAEQYIYNTSNTATIKLDSSGYSYFNGGNVGINTSSPLNKLQVNGDIGIGEINSTRSTNVRFAKNDTNVITFDISVGAVGAWRPGSCWIQVSGAQNGLQEYWSAWYFIRLTHYYLSGVAGQGTTNPPCILDSGGNTSSVVVGVSSTNTSNPQIITITLTDVGGTTNSMVADINCTMQMGINSIT